LKKEFEQREKRSEKHREEKFKPAMCYYTSAIKKEFTKNRDLGLEDILKIDQRSREQSYRVLRKTLTEEEKETEQQIIEKMKPDLDKVYN
jgi:hypothetical protein